MAKKGVKTISGPTAPRIGQPAIYTVTEWHSGTPDALKANVKWELFKKRNSGQYTTTSIIKNGPIATFTFGEVSANHDYKVEGYLFNPELSGPSTVNVRPLQGPPSITTITMLDYKGDKFSSTPQYGQTITISIETVNMIGEDLTVSLWERDTMSDDGHDINENTKLWETVTTVENTTGNVKVQKQLTLDMAVNADKGVFEGSTHEYYVVVKSNRSNLHNYSEQQLEVSDNTSGFSINSAIQEALQVIGIGNDPTPENGNSPSTVGEEVNTEDENKCPRCKKVTKEELALIFGDATDDTLTKVAEAFNEGVELFHIDTCEKKVHFFAQAREETGSSLTIKTPESLNYSARRLKNSDRTSGSGWVKGNLATGEGGYYSSGTLKTGPFSYFKNNPNDADLYGRKDLNAYNDKGIQAANEIAIANRAYANKYENGDIASGDGSKYRGKGIVQLTWKENYRNVNERLVRKGFDFDIVTNPDKLLNFKEGVLSAMAYFYWKDLHLKVGQTRATVDSITAVVNLNTDSYSERWAHFQTALTAFRVNECTKDEVVLGEFNLYKTDYTKKTYSKTKSSNSNNYKFELYNDGVLEQTFTATKNEHNLLKFPDSGLNWGRYGTRDNNISDGDNWINEEAFSALLGFFYSVNKEVTTRTLYYNDISSDDGVTDLGHSTHKTGKDIDIRYPGCTNAAGQQLWTYARDVLGSESKLDEVMTKIFALAVEWDFTNNYSYKAFTNTKNAAYSVHQNHFHIGFN
ncbi:hypothetical protein V6251_12705 [Olleya sp. Ti.3.14]|uniref:glycoside hydrolase family 19 protein n=1 Tax=Olleya sp. Ti.3.14 TaxID=3121297 RepID=UPI00311E2F0E